MRPRKPGTTLYAIAAFVLVAALPAFTQSGQGGAPNRELPRKGERLTTTLHCEPSPISVPIDGNLTAEVSIKHQWPPDS